eukprot:CAMPEP_0202771520 /NCGR_PEP_ID=MMETSP1388-20130828/40922_1 /ASSEMBLY_ACC=CAM_ASM_000864 /TAXON_ID=37098 /ORGANISM="Isochrysis sp, Strain CCMP1244" /LENGTH=245 /DNA_ID=CAMNT_0049440429 /DNA_START=27 /DNA_END=760 /DNA_ORIENTATION=-
MSQLADYRLLGELGCGSLGRVLLVRLQSSRTLRAMKVVERGQVSSAKQLAQLEAEGEVLAAISHPYIVKLYHTIRDAACNYYVLAYAAGGDLMALILRNGRIDEPASRVVVGSLVLALQHLHEEHSVVYRDVKPENVLVGADGHVLLADFNTARRLDDDTDGITAIGTPEYVAPEVVDGDGYSFAADWWGIGVLLHEVLLGQPPFMPSARRPGPNSASHCSSASGGERTSDRPAVPADAAAADAA